MLRCTLRVLPSLLLLLLWKQRERFIAIGQVLYWCKWPRWGQLRPFVLEPEGLKAALQALPERRLRPDELRALKRDGVLHIKGLIPNQTLLRWVAAGLQSYASFKNAIVAHSYLHNGYALALLRDGPFGALAADALGEDAVSVNEAPVFGTQGDLEMHIQGWWHFDRWLGTPVQKMMTVWLALREAPHGLEFVRGSHTARTALQLECNKSRHGGGAERNLDHPCTRHFAREHIEPVIGDRAIWWADLAPGDAVLFDGDVAHRGMAWPQHQRLTVALRFIPSVTRGECNRSGDWLHWKLAIHPRSAANFACLRQQWLARHEDMWARLDTSLPTDEEWDRYYPGAARLVRRTVEVVTSLILPAREE